MHRMTPRNAAYVGYTGGGARATVDNVDDGSMMQEMKGNFMKGEQRQKIEAPQNYGFTSVVLPAKKGKDGQIEESAEAFMSFMGGNRSFPVAGVMDDRRHRPMGLKPGENAQYDDLGQMTLMRRNGLFLLSLDSEDESQSQSGGGAQGKEAGPEQQAEGGASGGGGKKVERMVSLRHVEKKKQERDKSGAKREGSGGAAPKQLTAEQMAAEEEQEKKTKEERGKHKHEGETVNTEVRCTKNRIEFRTGDKVVGYYDVSKDEWFFTAKVIHNKGTEKVKDEAPKIEHN